MIATLEACHTAATDLHIRRLGQVDYVKTWQAMRSFTDRRDDATADEIWFCEHPPVYTLGIAGRSVHLPRTPNDIPVVRSDRGGQITYHGPGQIVAYLLLDMKRRGLTVRPLVRLLEHAVIDLLADFGLSAHGRTDAPGVYAGRAKVAALGLRITRGRSYHGIALNVDMDLSPFQAIDPCGYPGLEVTQTRDLGIAADVDTLSRMLETKLVGALR